MPPHASPPEPRDPHPTTPEATASPEPADAVPPTEAPGTAAPGPEPEASAMPDARDALDAPDQPDVPGPRPDAPADAPDGDDPDDAATSDAPEPLPPDAPEARASPLALGEMPAAGEVGDGAGGGADGPEGGAARGRRLPALGTPLALGALVLAVAMAAVTVFGEPLGVFLLPASAVLLALSAAFPARGPGGAGRDADVDAGPNVRGVPAPGGEAGGEAGADAASTEAARLRLTAVTIGVIAALLVLTTVEAFALMSFLGRVVTVDDVRSMFLGIWPLVLALVTALAAVGRIAAARWQGAMAGAGRGAGRPAWMGFALAGAAAVPAVVMALLVTAPDASPLDVRETGMPFLAAPALMAGLAAMWAGALPGLTTLGDWLTTMSRRDQAKVAKNLMAPLSFGALGGALGGAASWIVAGPGLGTPLLGVALALAVTAAYPAGLARFVPPLSLQDPEAALAARRKALTGMMAVGGVSLALALGGLLAWFATPDGSPLPALLLTGAIAAQAALPIWSSMVPVPGRSSKARGALGWYLSLAALLLVVFSLLVGTGLAQGPNVASSTAVMTLGLAAMANAGHAIVRLALPPPKEKRPKEADEARHGPPADLKEQVTRTMQLTYVAGLGFSLLMVGLVAATSMGVVDVEQGTGMPSGVLVALVALLGVPLVGFFAWKHLQARTIEVAARRQAEARYKRRLTPQEVTRLTILGVTVSAAVIFIVMGLLVQLGVVQSLGPLELTPVYSTDFFVFAILTGLGPYGFIRAREQARVRAIDAKFPEFLRDLAESKRAGMTLTQAVITASKGNYGALTQDIRKMAAQIEWGVSFGEALQRFALRVRTPLIERSVSLIVQASEAGGSVEDVLRAAADDAREIELLLSERKTSMSIYVMIIYISFFVFLSVIAILDAQFLPEVAKAVRGAQGVTVGPITFGEIDVAAFEQVFFHAAIVQALGGGFVAGVMAEGRPEAGLRHVFIMVIVGYVMFRFLIGG